MGTDASMSRKQVQGGLTDGGLTDGMRSEGNRQDQNIEVMR